MYMYVYDCVYVFIYIDIIYIHPRVGVPKFQRETFRLALPIERRDICTGVGAFCLFVLSNLSATCACITGVF